jgi:Tim44-like domain
MALRQMSLRHHSSKNDHKTDSSYEKQFESLLGTAPKKAEPE